MELACTLTQLALATNDAVCDCDETRYTMLCRPCLFLNKWKLNEIITRNAWQRLAYSPLGAIVLPPSLLPFISRVQLCRTSISDRKYIYVCQVAARLFFASTC